jgi:hypothetical protein
VTKKKPTARKKTTRKSSIKFKKDMNVDEIFWAWEGSARNALKAGQSYAPEIFDSAGATVKLFKRAITRHINQAKAAGEDATFTAADFRNSTRVATDIGRVCSILAASDKNHVVSLDMFQRAAKISDVHPACPRTTGGSGRWCEV